VVESARAAGAVGVLSKPFGEEQLLEVLEQNS
jgi:CheY-like chemotaxis protein